MTILLSNLHAPYDLPKKLIAIKPVHIAHILDEQDTSEADLLPTLEEKIMHAQMEYERILREQKQLIEQTKDTIAKELQEWEVERQQYIELAQEEGYASGFAAGNQAGLEAYTSQLEQANAITEAATKDYHATVEQSEETIIDLAVHTAEKIIKDTITEQPEAFLAIVTTAIKEIKDQSHITIYLNPSNYEFVMQQKEELVRLIDHDSKLVIYTNEEINENGCMIEHPFGKIDASIDTQLQQIRDTLQEIALENRK